MVKKVLGTIFVVLAISTTVIASDVSKAFQSSELVPDLIPVAPEALAQVHFGSEVLSPGDVMSLDVVSSQPQVEWEASSGCFYTLAIIDPDAPSHENPSSSPFNHLLVVNIPGDDVASGVVMAEYCSPTPPPSSGLHRYAILVYAQQSCIDDNGNKLALNTMGRSNFPLSDFIKKHQLGDPVAGNFFRAGDIMYLFNQ